MELGDKATEQPEMLVAANGQEKLPLGSRQRWGRLGEDESRGAEGMRNNPESMDR